MILAAIIIGRDQRRKGAVDRRPYALLRLVRAEGWAWCGCASTLSNVSGDEYETHWMYDGRRTVKYDQLKTRGSQKEFIEHDKLTKKSTAVSFPLTVLSVKEECAFPNRERKVVRS